MSDGPSEPRRVSPGTLTSLVDEVFRGASADGRNAWVEGLEPGTALGRYDLIREVGRGGFGVVWEARDRELGRRVAVKVIVARRDGVPERRLVAEAEVAARLSHPGIVTILDVGRNDRGAWLVQEFLTGQTLAARLEQGALPLRQALRVGLDVARALAHAHAHGVVHRDLTPGNVFLCDDGHVKLLDLGMAQAFGRRKLDGGTPDYMAPEQALGAPEDERVDVFALGALIYRMVAGSAPLTPGAFGAERVAARLETPELPDLGELVGRMLDPDPLQRPRDASQVQSELESLEASLPPSTAGTRPGAVRVRRRWPRWGRAAAGIAAILFAAGAGALGAGRWLAPRPERVAPVGFGAVATSNACDWGEATWLDLRQLHAGAYARNGELGGQGPAQVAGRTAWLMTSDWNQLFLPPGRAASGDPFAIEVEFFMPPATGWMRGASISAFAEPDGGDDTGQTVHGIFFGVAEAPGKAPWFDWYQWDGEKGPVHRYTGTLPGPVGGKWHSLRIEGSRSKGWYRGFLDGRPLVAARGDYDVSGSRIALGSGYGYMNSEDVAFSNFRTFAGTPECQ